MDNIIFKYPDASGIMRTWRPHCVKCDKVPTKCSEGNPYGALGYSKEYPQFVITDYGALYCDEHAPEWAVVI